MQDRDFSKYYASEDDGMIWLNSSKESWEGTTPVFPTQEAFIDALAQSIDEHSGLNCIADYEDSLQKEANYILETYGNKTEEELREDMIRTCNIDEEDEDIGLPDMTTDFFSMLSLYQQYLMISKKDMNVYNEVIDWYIREDPNELTDITFDFIDKKADKKYWCMEIGEETLGHEVTKLMLTDEEKDDFEKDLAEHEMISETHQVYNFLACIRLARKLINEE